MSTYGVVGLQFGDEGIPIGILYLNEKPTFMEQIPHITKPLVSYERKPTDIDWLLDRLVE